MTKSLIKPTTNYDITNKKYVDGLLQSDYEFKVFQQVFSQSGIDNFDKQVTIEEGWIPFGFFTVGTEGGVGYGYQSFFAELVSPTKVRCRGWCNVNGGSQIRIWLPCYRKKLAKNLLAYTTRDILWSKSVSSSSSIDLSANINNYDYIKFYFKVGSNYQNQQVKVSDLVSRYIFSLSWGDATRYFLYSGSSNNGTTISFEMGGCSLIKVEGIRVVQEKDLGGNVVKKIIMTGKIDGSGYFKNTNGKVFELPAGKVLLSARICYPNEGQDTTFWNRATQYGVKITPLCNPNSSTYNTWSILLRGWDDANNYANMTNVKMEIAYA